MVDDKTTSFAGREAYWIHGFETEPSDKEVRSKIFSAFEGVKSFRFKKMIFQFWQPVTTDDGRQLLESYGNIYAVSPYDACLREKYWACCMKYQYSIIHDRDNDPAWIISGGPFATAFLNRYPEVVPDLRALKGSPLADCALKCDLTCCFIIPVFYSGCSDCLGVVECSMKHPALLLPMFNELKRELERVGLCIYHVQGNWPHKTISGDLEAAKLEIEKALERASESHTLTLAQVWIQGESESNTSQSFLVKLSGHSVCSDDDPLSSIKDFYNTFNVVNNNNKGEGLAWRTLQTHQPHLCRNLYKLRDSRGVLALLISLKCASFVMCLRSAHTGDLEYLFEFFWPHKRDHLFMLQALILTLRSYLPSFKFASGEQLGDDIPVVDVESSCSSTPVGEKRKLSELHQYPLTNISNPEGEDDDEDDDLAMLATYRHQTLLLYLPSLSTYENVMEKLRKEFELDPARTYKVNYEASPGQWSSLTCLESCRVTEDMGPVKLRVLSNVKEVGWHWRTN